SLPPVDDNVGGDVIRSEPPGTDPYAGWCGGRELITPGYPIGLSFHVMLWILFNERHRMITKSICRSANCAVGPSTRATSSKAVSTSSYSSFFRTGVKKRPSD